MTISPTTPLKAALASIPGYLTALQFGPEKAIIAFIGMQLLDWATGVAAARKMGAALSSAKATEGAYKKGMMWAYISMASLGLWLAPMAVDSKRVAMSTVICGFIWVEVLSIAENGKNLGLLVDPRILAVLSWLEPKQASTTAGQIDDKLIRARQDFDTRNETTPTIVVEVKKDPPAA